MSDENHSRPDQGAAHSGDATAALAAAFQANDAAEFTRVIEQHPELKARLNDPIPGGSFGATPLLCAVQRGRREMIEALLAAGADINARSHWWAGGFGVLDSEHGLTEFLIERGALVDAHAAARLGMLDRLDQLVSADPGLVHARGGDGQTPLHFAKTVEVARYLLDHGADIDALDIDHESTPAQWMLRDRQDVARYLVSRGCRTDILMAAALGDVDRVRQHLAADPGCIRTSVTEEYFPMRNPRAGGTIYIWTLGQNKTAHLVARDFGHDAVVRLVLEHTPAEMKLAMACELGDEGLFNQLLTSRPNLVQSLTGSELRKLPDAAQANSPRAVELMLLAGWPADARGQHRATALHWAAWHGNAGMVRQILRHRPSLDDRENDFRSSPLGWAVHGSVNSWHRQAGDYPDVIDALLDAGAAPPEVTGEMEAVWKDLIARGKGLQT
jgi:ankyrin repeat protein